MPGATAVGADLELGNGEVGVDDLHGEPVGGGTALVDQFDRGGDTTSNVFPVDADNALGDVGQLGEGALEEIEVVGVAFGTFIDNLEVC